MLNRTIPLALAAALAAPLAAQDHLLPDSLAWTRMPKDPHDIPRLVSEGKMYSLGVRIGCISSGDAYSRVAWRLLFEAAETDPQVRHTVRSKAARGVSIFNKGRGDSGCPENPAIFEAWLMEDVRRDLRAGKRPGVLWAAGSRNPEVYALMLEVASDPELLMVDRRLATARLVVYHAGKYPLDTRIPEDLCLKLDGVEAVIEKYGGRLPMWPGGGKACSTASGE